MTLVIDQNEPFDHALSLISKTDVDYSVSALNVNGYADYFWTTHDGSEVHVERKTWAELLGSIDKYEDQLRRQKEAHPNARLIFVLEGMAVPSGTGTSLLKETNKGNVFVKSYGSTMRLSQVYAWLYQVGTYLEVYQTPNYEATCMMLVAMYKADQKAEHRTFQRYFKNITFSPSPQVTQVMGLLPGIGEKRAWALVERFTTVFNIITASPAELAEVDGIGKKLSVQLLQRVGRFDV